jgi:hypothetical protein
LKDLLEEAIVNKFGRNGQETELTRNLVSSIFNKPFSRNEKVDLKDFYVDTIGNDLNYQRQILEGGYPKWKDRMQDVPMDLITNLGWQSQTVLFKLAKPNTTTPASRPGISKTERPENVVFALNANPSSFLFYRNFLQSLLGLCKTVNNNPNYDNELCKIFTDDPAFEKLRSFLVDSTNYVFTPWKEIDLETSDVKLDTILDNTFTHKIADMIRKGLKENPFITKTQTSTRKENIKNFNRFCINNTDTK